MRCAIGQDLDYASSSKWGGELRGTEVNVALGAGQPQWFAMKLRLAKLMAPILSYAASCLVEQLLTSQTSRGKTHYLLLSFCNSTGLTVKNSNSNCLHCTRAEDKPGSRAHRLHG